MYRTVTALFLLLGTNAAADPSVCWALRETLPEKIMEFDLGQKEDHEDDRPGFGYSAHYDGADATLTADFFDLGKTAFGGEDSRELLEASLLAIMLEYEGNGGTYEPETVTGLGDPDFLFDYIALGDDSFGRAQFVAVAALQACMLRLRYSGPAGQDSASHFLDAMGMIHVVLQ
ncbi:MAG: hypothetical protein KDK10_02590 [Maritimibacter sp.]|nr:hypothetical protein [Maritimibacter sp.]